MAISRTRALFGGVVRHDVEPHMKKWWKGYRPNDGMITRTLSPYEQQALTPFLRSLPKKLYDDFMASFIYLGGALGLTFGTAILADEADAAQDRSHRY